jgi:hypothetical protein
VSSSYYFIKNDNYLLFQFIYLLTERKVENMSDELEPKEKYPTQSPPNLKPVRPKGRTSRTKEIAIIITTLVIPIIIYIMIILWLISLLPTYIVDGPPSRHDPLVFTDDPDVPGKYIGKYSSSVPNEKIDFILYDASLDQNATLEHPTDGAILQVPGGVNLTYYDKNINQKFDEDDIIILQGASPGDKVTGVWRSTGEIVGTATIE